MVVSWHPTGVSLVEGSNHEEHNLGRMNDAGLVLMYYIIDHMAYNVQQEVHVSRVTVDPPGLNLTLSRLHCDTDSQCLTRCCTH